MGKEGLVQNSKKLQKVEQGYRKKKKNKLQVVLFYLQECACIGGRCFDIKPIFLHSIEDSYTPQGFCNTP